MIVRSGQPFGIPIGFDLGAPDSNIGWQVLGPDGTVLATGTINVPANSVSVPLIVAGTYNTLTGGSLYSYRDVVWSYFTGGLPMEGEVRYDVEGRVPYGVSCDGVRNKLGVEQSELPDNDISLVSAYTLFATQITGEGFNQTLSDRQTLAVRDAIEATAALALIPTMIVRVAQKETSANDSFQRQPIDWVALGQNLQLLVADGQIAIDPTFDETALFGSLFTLATPATDLFTG